MKSVIKVLVGIGLLAYVVFAIVKWSGKEDTTACVSMDITIEDSTRAAFISENDVRNLIERKKLNPEGRALNSINLGELENAIKKHPFVLEAHCYKTPTGIVHVSVSQRLPVMRIMAGNNENYFIDANGERLHGVNYPADVVVATGDITPDFTKKHLSELGKILQKNDFWNSQIEQINVLNDQTVELIPRVGHHVVYLGEASDLEHKLARLKLFYNKVLSQVGWQKYNRINLEYANQIICTLTE